MLNKEILQKQFEAMNEEDTLRILDEEYQIRFNPCASCEFWYAKVFSHCSSCDLEYQLNEFLWFINFIVVPKTKSCFKVKDTVTIRCNPICGNRKTILYFTLSNNY